jgi:hypothetical protein
LIEAGYLEGDPEMIAYVFWITLHGAVTLQLANKLDETYPVGKIIDTAFTALNAGFAPKR